MKSFFQFLSIIVIISICMFFHNYDKIFAYDNTNTVDSVYVSGGETVKYKLGLPGYPVYTKKGHTVYYTATTGLWDNACGYFIQVYKDKDLEEMIDTFSIHYSLMPMPNATENGHRVAKKVIYNKY